MKSKVAVIVGVVAVGVVAVVVGVAGLGLFGGVISRSADTHPPCEELPTRAEADAGLAANRALVEELEALGRGVSVRVGTPCPQEGDRALIEVTYGSAAEREAIRDLLARRDGFGVPVHLVSR
ncbi:MAG: hypothetical protein DIU79_02875 [Actinobacteria bacterium]|nr:MAG: hypothetical protein DIU79_02875 [Actinomycetota bacterium]